MRFNLLNMSLTLLKMLFYCLSIMTLGYSPSVHELWNLRDSSLNPRSLIYNESYLISLSFS